MVMQLKIGERKSALELVRIIEDDLDFENMEEEMCLVFREVQRVLTMQHHALADYTAAIRDDLNISDLFRAALDHLITASAALLTVRDGHNVKMTKEEVEAIQQSAGFMAVFREKLTILDNPNE